MNTAHSHSQQRIVSEECFPHAHLTQFCQRNFVKLQFLVFFPSSLHKSHLDFSDGCGTGWGWVVCADNAKYNSKEEIVDFCNPRLFRSLSDICSRANSIESCFKKQRRRSFFRILDHAGLTSSNSLCVYPSNIKKILKMYHRPSVRGWSCWVHTCTTHLV